MKPKISVLISVALLTACADNTPLYEDYCASQNKRFSDVEKIEAALLYVLNRENSGEIGMLGTNHFLELAKVNKKPLSDEAFVRTYLNKHPSCCHVVKPPSYVKWYSSMRGNGFTENEIIGEPGDWIADISIDLPERQQRNMPLFKVSDCNDVEILPRG